MQRVTIVDLGENLPIQLASLVRRLNSLQNYFSFEEGASIPIARLGQPDYEYQWYYLDRLFEILRASRRAETDGLIVGFTHLRLTTTVGQGGDDGNRDYFSQSDYSSVAVIGLNPNVLRFNSPSKTVEQFAAFSVVAELLSLNATRDMFHLEVEYCLFDECVDRSSIQPAVERSWICERCMGKLKDLGTPQQAIDAARQILDWCRRDIGPHSVFSKTLMSPFTTFLVGSALGWTSSAFVDKANWATVVLPSVALIVLHYFYRCFQHAKRASPSRGIQRTGG